MVAFPKTDSGGAVMRGYEVVCDVCTPMRIRAACRLDRFASGGSRDVYLIMLLYRAGHMIRMLQVSGQGRRRHSVALRFIERLQKVLVILPFKVELPTATHIGPGLNLPHPHSVVFNSRVRIGSGCTVFHGVTIGERAIAGNRETPVVGNHVVIGTGAILLGPIMVGDSAVIGAGAVVTKSVRGSSHVVGHNRTIGSKQSGQKHPGTGRQP